MLVVNLLYILVILVIYLLYILVVLIVVVIVIHALKHMCIHITIILMYTYLYAYNYDYIYIQLNLTFLLSLTGYILRHQPASEGVQLLPPLSSVHHTVEYSRLRPFGVHYCKPS